MPEKILERLFPVNWIFLKVENSIVSLITHYKSISYKIEIKICKILLFQMIKVFAIEIFDIIDYQWVIELKM